MKIVFNGREVKIKKLDFPIKKEYFAGCPNLIKSLNKAGILKFKDLPQDLSKLSEMDMIGERTIEKFFSQIVLYEETIADKGYIIYKDKKDVPAAIYSLPIDALRMQTFPVIHFFHTVGIKKVGEIPANLMVLANVKQIGTVAIRKLFTELMQLKETYSKKKLFVLKDTNIILPNSLSLSTPITKIAPELKQFGFNQLRDIPQDLRKLEDQPHFQLFIEKLQKYIASYEEKINTKKFIRTFECLIKGRPVIGINEKYAKIIQYRFGSSEMLTLQEIGDKMNISRERVRQVINLVLVKVVRYHGSAVQIVRFNRKLHKGEEEFLKALQRKERQLNC